MLYCKNHISWVYLLISQKKIRLGQAVRTKAVFSFHVVVRYWSISVFCMSCALHQSKKNKVSKCNCDLRRSKTPTVMMKHNLIIGQADYTAYTHTHIYTYNLLSLVLLILKHLNCKKITYFAQPCKKEIGKTAFQMFFLEGF